MKPIRPKNCASMLSRLSASPAARNLMTTHSADLRSVAVSGEIGALCTQGRACLPHPGRKGAAAGSMYMSATCCSSYCGSCWHAVRPVSHVRQARQASPPGAVAAAMAAAGNQRGVRTCKNQVHTWGRPGECTGCYCRPGRSRLRAQAAQAECRPPAAQSLACLAHCHKPRSLLDQASLHA